MLAATPRYDSPMKSVNQYEGRLCPRGLTKPREAEVVQFINQPMNISLNGDPNEFANNLTLQQLLDPLQIPSGRVASDVNRKIIKRVSYPDTFLQEGDTVEIIHAIGGG